MSTNPHTQAASALIQWFNSQELTRDDARAVMLKVVAKLMVDQSTDIAVLEPLIDRHLAELQVELHAYLRHKVRGGRK